MSKKAIVLARGKSVENVKLLNPHDYDLCVIVNDWKRELDIDYLSYFVKNSKKVQHYVCREGFALLKPEQYHEYNIDLVRLNILKKEYYGIPPYVRPSPMKQWLDHYRVPSDHMKQEILNWSAPRSPTELRLPGFPTMGTLTPVDIATMYDYNDITILGVDFYEEAYMTVCSSNNQKHAPKKSGIGKAPLMKEFMTEFFNKRKDVNFTYYTYSSFDPNLPHVKINNKRLESGE